jgi:hypothetical protein
MMDCYACTHFLQDGALCNESKAMKAFLDQQGFKIMAWQGHSPDLNPTKNCWDQ